MTTKSRSVPTGRKRREDLRAGTTFGQNGAQKSQVKFKPCEISEKAVLFVPLSLSVSDALNGKYGMAYSVDFHDFTKNQVKQQKGIPLPMYRISLQKF
ncbi:hypothetical protein [Intestinimonas sp. HCP28S3_D6]|uniref:hypothetical protein n=1 Tax=Intestinimonas sp. HCP28S3_D6 TaxID=3438942 RepID=UPI003F8AE3A6